MNCPHGRTDEQRCFERGCVQNVFAHDERGGQFRVVKLRCDTCGHGVGIRRSVYGFGSGLSARTIREFAAKHDGHDRNWKMVDIDTGAELLGAGPVPVTADSDEKNVSSKNPRT